MRFRIRSGSVSDAAFDALYPDEIKRASRMFWTPVRVATRAAHYLARSGSRFLDVGAGPGKFCLVGAAAVGGTYVGIEHRSSLVAAADHAARELALTDHVEFLTGDLATVSARDFDGFYLFNPFEENLRDPADHFDATIPLDRGHYTRDVAAAERLLADARVGACVVTYEGFGGKMPSGYVRRVTEAWGHGVLDVWARVSRR